MNKDNNVLLLFLLLVLSFVEVQAGNNKRDYSVSKIPPQLLVNANSVMRYYKETDERTSLKGSVKRVVYAVTVLNAAGKKAGYFFEPYFKYSHVGSINAIIFDKNGKKVEKIPGEDILDIALQLASSLYSDARAKVLVPEYFDYPYTVEYSFKINNRSSLNIDSWQVYPTTNMSIEKKDYTIITPDDEPDLGIYYYLNDSSLKLDIQHKDGITIYHLHVENLPPCSF